MRKHLFYGIVSSLLVMIGLLLMMFLPDTLWVTGGVILVWAGFYSKSYSSLLLGRKDNSTIWKRD